MPTNEEIENAKKNTQVVDLKNKNLQLNENSIFKVKASPIKTKGEFTALRDIEIESGYSNPSQFDGGTSLKDLKINVYPVEDSLINMPYYYPLNKKWSIKKGETFNSDLIPERRYLKDGYLVKNGTKLYLGKDIEFTSKVKSTEEKNLTNTENNTISVDKNNLPWIIVGALVIYLILK